jgi:zinc protease
MYARFTQPGDDPQAFELMKRQLTAAIANRLDSPEAVFGDKLEEVNTSNHYIAQPLTVARINALDRTKMVTFYKDRFSNAADFTFYMVGAFTIDDALPLLQRYVGGLPSTGAATSNYKDVGIHFPAQPQRATVKKGREPKSTTVISFYAEPPASDPMEQERALAATDVLELALRDILREELGQTYTVSVDLSQQPPQTGGGHVEVSFGAAPENIDKMTTRVLEVVAKFKAEGPTDDQLTKVKETARRNYETSLKTNSYWLNRFKAVSLYRQDPRIIATRVDRINALTAASVKEAFNKYFPEGRTTVVTLMPQ